MDSVSSRARIFSVSLYLMADLIPRSTLRRSSSLARMASVRSFEIFSARVIAFPRAVEYSRAKKGKDNAETLRARRSAEKTQGKKYKKLPRRSQHREHRESLAYLTWRGWVVTVVLSLFARFSSLR